MGRSSRYEISIARLDSRAMRHNPGSFVEFFDLDDDESFRKICGKHFVPLACAAEGAGARDLLRDMPFLRDYVLEIRLPNRPAPVARSRSTYGWGEGASRFR